MSLRRRKGERTFLPPLPFGREMALLKAECPLPRSTVSFTDLIPSGSERATVQAYAYSACREGGEGPFVEAWETRWILISAHRGRVPLGRFYRLVSAFQLPFLLPAAGLLRPVARLHVLRGIPFRVTVAQTPPRRVQVGRIFFPLSFFFFRFTLNSKTRSLRSLRTNAFLLHLMDLMDYLIGGRRKEIYFFSIQRTILSVDKLRAANFSRLIWIYLYSIIRQDYQEGWSSLIDG